MAYEYRDRVYMRKDILINLAENGEMNQTRLLRICGLNGEKHDKRLGPVKPPGADE